MISAGLWVAEQNSPPAVSCKVNLRPGGITGGLSPGWLLKLLILTICLSCPSAGAATDPAAEQEARLQELRARIGKLKNELGFLKEKKDAVHQALEQAEKEIGTIAAAMHRLERETSRSRTRLQELDEERARQQPQLRFMRTRLASDLRAAYLMGKQEQVKLLLNQEDPAAVGRMMVYHGYFTRERSARMQAIRDALDELAAVELALIAEQERLEQLQAQQRERSVHLENSQSKRRRVLAGLQSDLKQKSGELTTLERDEQRLQELVQSLQKALRDIPPAAGQYQSLKSHKGKLVWPVAGRIAMGYGKPQAGGKLESRGILISAPAGAEVSAIARGRVVFAEWLRGFGLLLILDHGEGYMSLYGHNRSLFKEVGEWVGHGEVIAAVGSSGGQPRAGLYLELRRKGRPFNPAPWFAGKPANQRAGR